MSHETNDKFKIGIQYVHYATLPDVLSQFNYINGINCMVTLVVI